MLSDDPVQMQLFIQMASQQHRPPRQSFDRLDIVGRHQPFAGEVAQLFRQSNQVTADLIEGKSEKRPGF